MLRIFIKSNKSGSALLIAMLVMAGVVTISVGTSKLVLNEIKQSADLDQAVVAFYASESGLEQGLYFSRQTGFSASEIDSRQLILNNGSRADILAKEGQKAVYVTSVSQDQAVQLDLFNPSSLNQLDQPIRAVKFKWSGPSNSVLEVSRVRWNAESQNMTPTQDVINWTENGSYLNFPVTQDNNLYRLRLVARLVDINSLTVTAYSQNDPEVNCQDLASCQIDIPGLVAIKSIGEYPADSSRASRQAVSVTLPLVDSLSNLFNFVLYSEQDITKELK